MSPIVALDRLVQAFERNQPLPEDLRAWAAGSITRFLEHDCDTLNEAFGICQGHGGIPWWRERAIRTRDEAIRELAARHLSCDKPSAMAREVQKLTERYAGTAWPRDRQRDEMPAKYHGTPKQYLWIAFKSGAKMPLSDRHLRNLLAGL